MIIYLSDKLVDDDEGPLVNKVGQVTRALPLSHLKQNK